MNDELMTDDEEAAFNAAVADPSTIETEAYALEIIAGLDDDIETIRRDLDAAKIEADVCGLSEPRRDWVRRAAGALSWKIQQKGAVGRRLRELQPAEPVVTVDRVALAKIQLQRQEVARQTAAEKQAAKERNIALSGKQTACQSELFVLAAKKMYSADENARVWALAREMFPDHPGWAK
jgi:hypothetical protein